ncbi:MAG: HlyD family efflux transporter periplasmic adaptor subunit [Isosphaeraceae bacterium]
MPQPGANAADFSVRVRRRRPHNPRWWMMAASVTLTIGLGTWFAIQRTRSVQAEVNRIPTVEVDRGDVPIYVVETGSLESTDNATVKCQVEALLGAVTAPSSGSGSRQGGAAAANTGTRSTGTAASGKSSGGVAGAAGMGGNQAANKSVLSASGNTNAVTSAGGGAAGAAGGGAGGAAGGATGGQQGIQAPTIRSFTYRVTPHVPLRPRTSGSSGGSGGSSRKSMGGGGGGGGGGFGGAQMDQKGSTTIIWILPEGTEVKPLGEGCDAESSFDDQGRTQPCADCDSWHVVCKLDSAAFEDELLSQTVRYQQAEAWVEQATALLDVNEISLKEYRDGILAQDRALVAGYKLQCDLELRRCRETMQWSTDALQKGFRTANQLTSDRLALQRAEVQEQEAETMGRRLEEYSAPRLISNLEAKSASIRSDLLAQKAALKVESDRLARIKKMIEYCTMWAPREGVVVYANQTSSWGRGEVKIMEGATVRERQPIFNLPNPNRMSVRVKINESKISSVRNDQPAEVLIDAFPERALTGKVTQITAVSAPTNMMSDVKVYNAVVELDDGGFEGLKPGLTAAVSLFVENREDVVRVPVGAVRWIGDEPFAAKVGPDGQLTWLALELGKVGTQFAEVLDGLQPGDRLAAEPQGLPLPARLPVLQSTEDDPGRLVRAGRRSREWSRDDVAKSRQSRNVAEADGDASAKKARKGAGGGMAGFAAKFARISAEDRAAMKSASEEERAAILKKAGFTDDELKQMREMAKGAMGSP